MNDLVLSFTLVSRRGCGNGGNVFVSTVSTAQFASVGRHPIFINNGEAIERGLPIVDRHGPFLSDIP